MADRDLDLLLYGATGFTGRLVAHHLAARTAGTDLRWGLAGRNAERLRQVADQVGAPDVELVTADATDPAAVAAMAARTRVVCTTVGPYARYGSDLVAACARAGTDYCDLTGEVQWIRRMIDAHHDQAAASGARIVHCCGFDSIPSDLGTWFAQQSLHDRDGVHAPVVDLRVKTVRGGASGGTIASLLVVVEEAADDRDTRRVLVDPDALDPDPQRRGRRRVQPVLPRVDPVFGEWIGPFVMEVVNSRVVRRTNALLGRPWGEDFAYTEAMLLGQGPLGAVRAGGLTAGLGVGMAALAVGPVRRLAGRLLPDPGQGPSPEAQRRGFFDLRIHAAHPDPDRAGLLVRVHGDRDPGYGSTAKMLGEAALCLAAGEPAVGGGSWTPASALGRPLLDRLQAHAGVTFTVVG